MINFLTKSSQYAIQAIMFLAVQPKKHSVFQRDIAKALNIPNHFLGKILQMLVRHDLIISQKGKNGGFIINDDAGKITLDTIVQIIDGDSFLDGCVVGFPNCSDSNPCPVHNEWKNIQQSILQLLKNKHIEDLGQELDMKLDYIQQLEKEVLS